MAVRLTNNTVAVALIAVARKLLVIINAIATTNGNCAASGTRTPVSLSATTPGAAVLVMVNP